MAASAAARSPATNASRPSAAMSAPTTAAASVRVPSRATSNVAIGLTRARFGTDVGDVPDDPLVRGDRTDRRQDELARDDVGDPAGGGRPGVLADPAQGDDHRQPDGQATQRQRRPARVAVDRAPGEPLLDPQQQCERRAGDPGHDRQQERDEERADEEDGVDQQGLPDAACPGRSRQDEDPDEGDRDEDRGEPAQACRPRRGQVEPRLERLDRLDPAGASRGLEGGRERDADADEQGDGHDVERHGRAVQRDRSDGPDEGDHGHRQEHAEHEAEERADDAEHQRLGEHVAHDLAPPGPRRAQEARPRGTAPRRSSTAC